MKSLYLSAILLAAAALQTHAQTPVSVGAGSYASFPPASENTIDGNNDGKGDLYQFVYDRPIYVAADKMNKPIPTNDWWTDLVVSQYGGLMWAYPLVADPEDYGVKMYYPNSFVADGSNIAYGGSMMIKAAGYTPSKAIAKDWSDWGLVMSLPDSLHNKNMDVTMAHGIPFMWLETQGINPEFSFDRGASYLTQSGSAIQFPTSNSFVIQTDGRYFGIHLSGSTTAELQGQQYVRIDLGSVQTITKVKLNWETAFAKGYAIQVSSNGTTWSTVASEVNGNGGLDSLSFNTSGRYIKLALGEKGSIYAYSLWEMEVFNGATLLSRNKPVEVSSVEAAFAGANVNDGNTGTRWASDGSAAERLVLNTGNGNAYFVVSALPAPGDLPTYETYAFNKVTNTAVGYDYDANAGKVYVNWNITTANLKGQAAGNTIQGFLPHLYQNAANSIAFTAVNYVTPRGSMKTAIGKTFSFTYDFNGILPTYNSPYRNAADASPYNANAMFDMLTRFSKKTGYGGDTYWGGKDLVNYAKYTLMAKELNHQAYQSLKAKTRESLVNWLTYTPGETEKFFARYDRWGAIVGFNESYGSAEFTDNHFHYGYLIYACALYGMTDPDFLTQYGPMIKLVAKQYANWDRTDNFLPFFRTFDPWIGHSYAGGTSSSTGNNQESTSEAMQSWIGLFLLGDMLNDEAIRDAGAFGYISEAYATLEYWFDWKNRNLPAAYPHNIVGILSNQGFAYGTYFSASPVHIHGIQYLPVNPGFKYLAKDTTWAKREYSDMMTESAAIDGHTSETDFGDDWAHVALGFRQLFDPKYAAGFMANNLALAPTDTRYIMDYEVAGMTYFYTHANQNLGFFSFNFRTNFPSSSVFEKNGAFSYAVAYNPAASAKTCNVYNAAGAIVASFNVPARTLVTYPTLPTTGQQPTGCYGLLPATATATSGNAALAVDGSLGSRWESAFTDPQQLTVDLAVISTVNKISISWEVANAKNYTLTGSLDGNTWLPIATKTNMPTGNRTDIIDNLNGNYRYIRMDGTARNTQWGYSIYELEVCGTAATGAAPLVADNTLASKAELKTDVTAPILYPNPANDWVKIQSKTKDIYSLTDLQGKMIQTGKLDAGINTIDISRIPKGLYIIRIKDQTFKLIKSNQ
ncbi:glycosyl hydrolase [Chitinophaga pinensis]|uniref:glucan endo-1,3-beta-D-glucosidase n=1 Tax=Chitinophaga pinensis (strain ATCC 43595 / DSM 2588 / LMG 13176 / NBRC 15968 / NCIMB 11800 / UQM 2034) TaxID=485918 RepID=A0A979GW37_CHIPD|nr:glycosyl hydrolase [Chitinophaga pinensis]ACU60275.1 coagulation factor 5/8 type domain protein [Chitinophaga pinensis DSM 2588]